MVHVDDLLFQTRWAVIDLLTLFTLSPLQTMKT